MSFRYSAKLAYESPPTTQKSRRVITVRSYDGDVSSVGDLKQKARQQLDTYVSNASHWEETECKISFDNPPWKQPSEPPLEDVLAAINGVKWARFEAPLDGAYRAPRYHLGVSSGQESDVKKRVVDYYAGLVVDDSGGEFAVIISPSESLQP